MKTLYVNQTKHEVRFNPPGEIQELVILGLTNWCEERLHGYFWVGSDVAYFEKESDAILFRLTWG